MNVYVHLAHGYDARNWERRWRSGELIGFNEPSPYGYHHARAPDCALTFSRDATEGPLGRLVRGGLRVLLGYDLVHAWRNRSAVAAADVVWTHTESQHLAIATLCKAMRLALPKRRRPRIVAQSVWLIDRWDRLDPLRKALYRRLMAEADVLTFLSPVNRDRARALFPGKACEFVPFGISTDTKLAPAARMPDGEIRVVALGNDKHRDWPTLLAAFGNRPGFRVRIASGALDISSVAALANVEIVRPKRNDELIALYRWADIVVLPLQDNLHASGITVLEEAALAGRPVVCTRAGGLEHYFTDGEVAFVPTGDAAAMREATAAVATDPDRGRCMAAAAQARMAPDDLGSRSYAQAHVKISRRLLNQPSNAGAVHPHFKPTVEASR